MLQLLFLLIIFSLCETRCLKLDSSTEIYLNLFLSFLYLYIYPGFDFQLNSTSYLNVFFSDPLKFFPCLTCSPCSF